MDIHSNNSRWKVVLVILGAGILLASIAYSNYLANRLKENEKKNIGLYIEAMKRLVEQTKNIDTVGVDIESPYNSFLEMVRDSFPLPVIAEDEAGNLEGFNFGDETVVNQEALKEKKKGYIEEGGKPILGSGYFSRIYCLNSPLLQYIKLFPIAQGLLVGLYIALGYFLFSSSRRAEQNRVWAGMAKETAHQLGTPISAIMGWIEYLKETHGDKPDDLDVINELTKDINRLELVADRFSKIGSDPVLTEVNLYDELVEVRDYLQRRAPKKVEFDFVAPPDPIMVPLNTHLFHWVIENLIRNSLDAMDGKGKITCICYTLSGKAHIELTDTGHGIASHKFKSVFKPGYSTKKRGWGLGLSLAKRIISEYHSGKIYVKGSKPHKETTFSIVLPM
jgi:hypothetical protein